MTEDPHALRARLESAEREEEWALLRLLGWIALLAFVLFVLLFSPVPWGALVGLVLWAWGARAVYASFSDAVQRTSELRSALEASASGRGARAGEAAGHASEEAQGAS